MSILKQRIIFSYFEKKKSTDGNWSASFLSTKRKRNSLTEGYALQRMKFLQSLAGSVFECVERQFQFSGSWEACSNPEIVTKLKTFECGILSSLTKQNK